MAVSFDLNFIMWRPKIVNMKSKYSNWLSEKIKLLCAFKLHFSLLFLVYVLLYCNYCLSSKFTSTQWNSMPSNSSSLISVVESKMNNKVKHSMERFFFPFLFDWSQDYSLLFLVEKNVGLTAAAHAFCLAPCDNHNKCVSTHCIKNIDLLKCWFTIGNPS